MKERPLLFSSAMSLATREGRKSQTRRLVGFRQFGRSDTQGYDWTFRGTRRGGTQGSSSGLWQDLRDRELLALCPYGEVGTRLWIQESYALEGISAESVRLALEARTSLPATCHYLADGARRAVTLTPENLAKLAARKTDLARPLGGRFMYRSCSRTLVEVASVRVERLQEISEVDALAEGIRTFTKDGSLLKYWPVDPSEDLPNERHPLWCAWRDMPKDPRLAFRALWESIHGPGSWALDPWLWVVSFKLVEAL